MYGLSPVLNLLHDLFLLFQPLQVYGFSPVLNLLHDLFLLIDLSLLLLPVVDHLCSDVEVSHHQCETISIALGILFV